MGRNQSGIPTHCYSKELMLDVAENLPNLLDLGPDAASIKAVRPMADAPVFMSYPPVMGSPARYRITCSVKVTFSNGLMKYGMFEESQDEYGQVKVSFNG